MIDLHSERWINNCEKRRNIYYDFKRLSNNERLKFLFLCVNEVKEIIPKIFTEIASDFLAHASGCDRSKEIISNIDPKHPIQMMSVFISILDDAIEFNLIDAPDEYRKYMSTSDDGIRFFLPEFLSWSTFCLGGDSWEKARNFCIDLEKRTAEILNDHINKEAE